MPPEPCRQEDLLVTTVAEKSILLLVRGQGLSLKARRKSNRSSSFWKPYPAIQQKRSFTLQLLHCWKHSKVVAEMPVA